MASVGVDVNHDGRANYMVTGVDMNRDGIPDYLQQAMPQAMSSAYAAPMQYMPPIMMPSSVAAPAARVETITTATPQFQYTQTPIAVPMVMEQAPAIPVTQTISVGAPPAIRCEPVTQTISVGAAPFTTVPQTAMVQAPGYIMQGTAGSLQVANPVLPVTYTAPAPYQPVTYADPAPAVTYAAPASYQSVTYAAQNVAYGAPTVQSCYAAPGPVLSYVPAPEPWQTTGQTFAPTSYTQAAPAVDYAFSAPAINTFYMAPESPKAQPGPPRGLPAVVETFNQYAGIEYVEPAPAVYIGPAMAADTWATSQQALAWESCQTGLALESVAQAGAGPVIEFVTQTAAGVMVEMMPQGGAAIEYVEPAPAIYIGPALTVPPATVANDYGAAVYEPPPVAYAPAVPTATQWDTTTTGAPVPSVLTIENMLPTSPAVPTIENMLVTSAVVPSIENMLAQAPAIEFVVPANQYSPGRTSTWPGYEYAMPAPTVVCAPGPAVEYYMPAPTYVAAQAPAVEYAMVQPAAVEYVVQQPAAVEYVVQQPAAVEYVAPAPAAAASPGAEIEYVTLAGMQIPVFQNHHLISWHPIQLREHAVGLYQTLGPGELGIQLPTNDHELIPWILHVQRVHMEPLRANPVLMIEG